MIDWEAEGLLEGVEGEALEARRELLERLAAEGVPLEELREAVESASERWPGTAPATRHGKSPKPPVCRSTSCKRRPPLWGFPTRTPTTVGSPKPTWRRRNG